MTKDVLTFISSLIFDRTANNKSQTEDFSCLICNGHDYFGFRHMSTSILWPCVTHSVTGGMTEYGYRKLESVTEFYAVLRGEGIWAPGKKLE